MDEALKAPDFPGRRVRWSGWYEKAFLKVIESAKTEWEAKHGDIQKLVREQRAERGPKLCL